MFADYSQISSWAKQDIAWDVDNGIINGSNGPLNPQGTATRAQVAQVFMNAQDLLVNKTIDIGTPEPTKANIAMLFSRSYGLPVGKLALEHDFDNPVYISNASYPYHNYRVVGLNNENDIIYYLLSFMTEEIFYSLEPETEMYVKDGVICSTIPPHGMTTSYNADSIKIVSGSAGNYTVSIDAYSSIPTTYAGTSFMTVIFDDGEYKISGYADGADTSNPVSVGEWLPNYLQYKTW